MSKRITLFVTILILGFSLITITSSCNKGTAYKQQTLNSPEAKIGDKVICPGLGTKFTVKQDSPYYTYKGKKYYVCCPECIDKLKENPEKYLKK